jgi:nitrogen fixation protein FixH
MNNSRYFPWLLVVIGSGFLALTAWSIFLAAQRSSAVIDRDYYSHGLRYNETLLERQAAATLGWTVSTERQGQTLLFRLSDKQGRPVSTAKGTVYLYLPAQASNASLPLREIAPGTYQLHLTGEMTGEISARLEFVRDGALLNRQLLLNL